MIKTDSKPYASSIVILVLASMMWGSTFAFTKILVQHITPAYLIGIRFALGGVILFIFGSKTFKKEIPTALKDKLLWAFAFINFTAILLQTIGLKYTSATNGGFITSFSIFLVPVLKVLHYKKKISHLMICSILIALFGLYLISFGFASPLSFRMNIGDILMFLCAICYGYHILFLEKLSQRFSAQILMGFAFTITAILGLIYASLFESVPSFQTLSDPPILINLIFLTIIGGVIPYALMVKGQKHLPAEFASLIYSLEPIFAMLIARAVLSEFITTDKIIGGTIVFTALCLGIYSNKDNSVNISN